MVGQAVDLDPVCVVTPNTKQEVCCVLIFSPLLKQFLSIVCPSSSSTVAERLSRRSGEILLPHPTLHPVPPNLTPSPPHLLYILFFTDPYLHSDMLFSDRLVFILQLLYGSH